MPNAPDDDARSPVAAASEPESPAPASLPARGSPSPDRGSPAATGSSPTAPGIAAERMLVVSNRLPFRLSAKSGAWRAERSAGGLATAIDPILKKQNGIWIGWPGSASGIGDPARRRVLAEWAERDRLIAVDLPEEIARPYYEGYSNQVIWPVFHYFPPYMRFEPHARAAYAAANEMFRDVVASQYRPGDLIWVHDYHLMLLPRLLREALPEARIGFFLHIPFPSSEVFRILPRCEELLEGLIGADVIAFQTHSHLQHFRSSLTRLLGRESQIDHLEVGGRSVNLEALPIGIAPGEFDALLAHPESRAFHHELTERYRDRRILLAVDRLDYTKGIPHRLRTYRRLLEGWPALRGRIVLIQVAVPSREHIFSYEALRREVNELVGEINGHYGTPDWTPVVYIRRGISPPELAALYRVADVGWVTPLRDGMNLVAKEYVACQREDAGVLVLSEFAGAAEEMGEALLVNPVDEEETAAAVASALAMAGDERRERMHALRERVERNNVFAWSERFLWHLRNTGGPQVGGPAEPRTLPVNRVVAEYARAGRRVLLLDYDGSLVRIARRPERAVPPPEVRELLAALAGDPKNCVLVISGRRRDDLERWFGGVPRLALAAEHGALLRPAGAASWEALRPEHQTDWKRQVAAVFQHFVDRTPGTFIEEKEYGLAWHYREVAPQFGEWLAHELAAMLEGRLADTELRAFHGRKVLEVRPLWINKGVVAERFIAHCGARDDIFPDFRLAIGDDRTDEDLFQAAGPDAWTILVGRHPTRARFTLPTPAEVIQLLSRLDAIDGRTPVPGA